MDIFSVDWKTCSRLSLFLMEQIFTFQLFMWAITILMSKMEHGKHLEINTIIFKRLIPLLMIEKCSGIVSEIWRTPVFVLISLWNVMEPEARSFWNLFVPGAAQT